MAFTARQECSTCLASLILEVSCLRKQDLMPFLGTHALVGIEGSAPLILIHQRQQASAIRCQPGNRWCVIRWHTSIAGQPWLAP